VAPKLLLDEHLSPVIAHRLTALGFDVTSVRDRGLLGVDDWDLVGWCNNEGRAICTRDDEDFEREHKKYLARGEIHFGIITVGEWTTEQTFAALAALLENTEDADLLNQFVTLDEPSPSPG
jgi:predicted nuclease of predicted toxin-antitoxin system